MENQPLDLNVYVPYFVAVFVVISTVIVYQLCCGIKKDIDNIDKKDPSNVVTNVPILTLNDIIKNESETTKKRVQHLIKAFENKYKNDAEYIVRSPGRVNLIGEHVDYCGYDVLPMAINKDILFAVKLRNDNIINLSNTEKKFTDKAFDTKDRESMKITKEQIKNRHWTLYFKAAFLGVLENFDINNFKGMDIMISGNIPKGSGLSSSSAFVCGALMSILKANKTDNELNTYKTDYLANICIKCERHVGVDSGGMDQTICMMAQKGYAKHIKFIPKLAGDNVSLPNVNKCSWLIANCLREHTLMDDKGTQNYNTRVLECRLGTLMLGKGLKLDKWEDYKTLRQIQDKTGLKLSELLDKSMDIIDSKKLTIHECLDILELRYIDLNDKLSDLKTGQKFLKMCYDNKYQLPIQLRVLHVYGEALRVLKFKELCNNNIIGNNKSELGVMKELGKLMNDSHESCRIRYECSCVELDDLVDKCRNGGAIGSRLTGAGWGGCVVNLVQNNKINDLKLYLKKNYYANIPNVPIDSMFDTVPSQSLHIINLK